MNPFEIKVGKEDKETYAFIKTLMIFALAIIFFGVITYMELAIVINYIFINWSIYYFVGFIIMYITLTLLELKEGAINAN